MQAPASLEFNSRCATLCQRSLSWTTILSGTMHSSSTARLLLAKGTKVAYVAVATGDIHEMNVDGGVPEKICEDCIRPWDWSPGGKKLLYLLLEGRGNRPEARIGLGLLDVASRRKSDYLESPRYDVARPRFSPDGRWISFSAAVRPGFNHVMIAPFESPAPPEDKWITVTDATTFNDKARWSPDGNLLYFLSDLDGYRCIYCAASRSKVEASSRGDV